jgi:hypothetical protein
MKPLSHNAMRTIVRCAMLAPALAFGLPGGRAEDRPEQKTAPALPPENDPAHAPASSQPAKTIPLFLARTRHEPVTSAPAHALATGPANSEEAARKPPANPEVSASIRHSFPYVPSVEPVADEPKVDPTLPVIEMKPFHVATGRIVERVTKGMEERRQKELEKAFNVKDGGRFGKIGPAEIGLKFDPKHKGWDILSIPW